MRARGFAVGRSSRVGAWKRLIFPAGGGLPAGSPIRSALACLCLVVGLLASMAGSAQAAVTHEFLSGPSAKLNQGIPAVGPHGEAIALPGPLRSVGAMTVDGGDLYIAENLFGSSRVDVFDSTTGAFVRQFDQSPSIEGTYLGVAVGHATGATQIYVGAGERIAGELFSVVAVYDAEGHLVGHPWTGEDTPNGAFSGHEAASGSELEGKVQSVAVDSNPTSLLGDWAAGDVLVDTSSNITGEHKTLNVIDVLKPEAGGGEKYQTQLTGTCESPGACPGKVLPFNRPTNIAVDSSNGDVFVADEDNETHTSVVDIFKPGPMVNEYEFVGKLTGPGAGSTFAQVNTLAVDSGNGDIYVGDGQSPAFVDQFNAADEYEGRLVGPPAEQFSEVTATVDSESHDVYVADYSESEGVSAADVFGPDIVLPDAVTEAASNVEPLGAVLNGKINPRKAGNASCEFVWGTSTALGQVVPCEPSEVAEGSSPVAVHAGLTGLRSDTTYYYRLQATNKEGTNTGETQDHEFTTPGPGLLASASDVASTSATLDATVNPHNHPTSYYFQYGKGTAYESEVPLAPGGSLGSGEGGLEVDNHIQGLSPGTVYHYRLVAVSELGAGITTTFPGVDQTFTTHAAGSGFVLPDNRQWELVSPPNKHGASIYSITPNGSVVKSSLSGGAVTYVSFSPPEEDPMGYFQEAQTISIRGAGSWSSQDISLPHRSATTPSLGHGAEYKFFSEDLSQALVEPWGEFTSLAPQIFPRDTESAPDIRHDFTCDTEPATCFQPLLTAAPGYADVPSGTQFGGGPKGEGLVVDFDGANSDLTHVVMNSGVALTSTPVTGNGSAQGGWLYDWSADTQPSEELQLVSLLPQNEGGTGVEGTLGYRDESAKGAISDDGSRIVWSTEEGLYLRDTRKGVSLRLDGVQQGASGKGRPGAHFQIANSDASIVFFTESRRLTQDSGAVGGSRSEPDLYECEIVEVAGELQCKLSDLTPLRSGHNADVQGAVLGASEDGSYIYFVAAGALTGTENADHEKAVAGANNLYMLHRDVTTGEWEAPRLVAVLSSEDRKDWDPSLVMQTTRVSHDGRYLAFMSNRALTGYDTRDANSGHPDEEVYLFDASKGRVVCVSCDPTGARPTGIPYPRLGSTLAGGRGVWEPGTWIAANIPGWTSDAEKYIAHYQSRYLSDEGRLFFNSSDALVSQDINGTEDVYEYEPAGIGSCSASSGTFATGDDGCADLISSGTSSEESAFLDANGDGSDVFFLSKERLVPQDVDTALDVYDAHVCTDASPCPNVPVSSPACVTADACRAAPLPQPSAFGAPASSTFTGAGNVTPTVPIQTAKPKVLTRAQKLARALSVCRKKKGKGKRAACERQARKRYGAERSRKSNATKRGKG
jgi:hypothetical protein